MLGHGARRRSTRPQSAGPSYCRKWRRCFGRAWAEFSWQETYGCLIELGHRTSRHDTRQPDSHLARAPRSALHGPLCCLARPRPRSATQVGGGPELSLSRLPHGGLFVTRVALFVLVEWVDLIKTLVLAGALSASKGSCMLSALL